MIEICPRNVCTGCEACSLVCPKKCISMIPDKNGFYYPEINFEKCIECRKCLKTCPNNREFKKNPSDFYMGWHKDKAILLDSSSGGAFTAIAQQVLRKKGIVFGAYFDDDSHSVEHISVEQEEQLNKLRLSKYFQGRIHECYKNVEIELNKNRKVLFTGTACQIAGLYAFLEGDFNNLLTADVLCHGITSKKVVEKYIISKEKKYRKKVSSFRFRLKPSESDWMRGGGTKMRLDFIDGTKVIEEKEADTFFMGFNTYLFLRESCYQCKYVGTERIADITLADYWGVDLDSIPDEQRRNGVSLVIANSQKGKELVSNLGEDMVIMSADKNRAVPANQAFLKPSTFNENRDAFFLKLDNTDFDSLIHMFNRKRYVKIKVRRLLGDKAYENIKKILGR